MSDLMTALCAIQSELKAPKHQRNNFGNYNYRSCEDIMEALKPHLKKHGATVTISDCIKQVDNVPQMVIVDESTKPKKKEMTLATLVYVEATATFTMGEFSKSVTAQAGVDINKAGMDVAQCFGASSSYARKYALNGLFLIDDNKDTDTTNTATQDISLTPAKVKQAVTRIKAALKECKIGVDVIELYRINREVIELMLPHDKEEILNLFAARKTDFEMEAQKK